MEQKVGVKLFHRSKQGCTPTPAARLLFDKAARLQEFWSDLSQEMKTTHEALSETFRIGCHSSVGAYTLPHFLKMLSASAPKIEVRLTHDWSRKITEKIVTYELDIGFVINPAKHPDLVLTKLGTDRVTFWQVKDQHPCKRVFADVSMHQVQELIGKRHANRFQNWQFVETTSLELIRTLTVSGAGVGILPERVAKAEGARLEIVDSNLPVFRDEIYLAYRAETLKSVAGKALISVAKQCLETIF